LGEIEECKEEGVPYEDPLYNVYGNDACQMKFGPSQKLQVIGAMSRIEPFTGAYIWQTSEKEN
jgi:hypothetical protein